VYPLEYTEIPNFSSRHIMDDDVSKATKGITKATMVSKAIVVSKVIAAM
jgi:hypothetical protein